jgi:hypothetical protein
MLGHGRASRQGFTRALSIVHDDDEASTRLTGDEIEAA